MALTPGTRLGPYEILSALGTGGMGEVYRARDPRLDRQVAIKLLPAAMAADTHARERLRREAMAVAALDHPYICKIYEIGEEGDALFLVMETSPGRRCINGCSRAECRCATPSAWPGRLRRRFRKPMPGGCCTAT